MFTIIYTKVKDQTKAIPKLKELRVNPKDKASARVIEFWQGEVERCDMVLVGDGCEKVGLVYKDAGIPVKDLFEKPKKVEEVKPVEVVEPVVEMVSESVAEATAPEVQAEQTQETRGRGRPRKE